MSTAHHAKYFAHELTRRHAAGTVGRLAMSLFDASVDLNPHQIDAALFAMQSRAVNGVLLADEVGLGKTIEAGLVLAQLWAERRRRLLVIAPAALRKQWSFELREKFHLPAEVADASTLGQSAASTEPWRDGVVHVTSYQFAARCADALNLTSWDLVVIDEAHRLRNSYREGNVLGQRLRGALRGRRLVLLTATPLQNSLLELYGLASFLDDTIFGDAASFRDRYSRPGSDLQDLQRRLDPFCKRTLRRQVTEYISYTERRAMTRPFTPTDDEQRLYDGVTALLDRTDSYSLPSSQRQLVAMVLRKLLASSSQALASTLDVLRQRLIRLRQGLPPEQDVVADILAGDDLESDLADEAPDTPASDPQLQLIDRQRLDGEIAELDRLSAEAHRIQVDAKSHALLSALDAGFEELTRTGARRKALVFTESRRTQDALKSFLDANGWAGRVAVFNGSNTDPASQVIYERWLSRHAGSDRVTDSRPIDIRTALVEHFRDEAEVLIATEAGAEGVNFQFCSLVINYDLPWNPQRVEQRIGRCHRYGQEHDVVVVNFLNARNQADQRVLQLLTDKFNLFNGVFGASDDVLGSIESGVDFERRIHAIYETCRTAEQIDAAFQALRAEMDESIRARMDDTRRMLLEHFDEDVHARLRIQLDAARTRLSLTERLFWSVTRFVLQHRATFADGELAFRLLSSPLASVPIGRYALAAQGRTVAPQDHAYRLSHPLGEWTLETGRGLDTPCAHLHFDLHDHEARIAALEPLTGASGWLALDLLRVEALDVEEDLLFSGFTDDGRPLDQELAEKLFRLDARSEPCPAPEGDVAARLRSESERHVAASLAKVMEANGRLFERERQRLEAWADDRLHSAEQELVDVKARLRVLKRDARLATTTEAQHGAQRRIRDAETEQRRLRQQIFDVEDDITRRRDELIDALERRLRQRTSQQALFTIRWSVA